MRQVGGCKIQSIHEKGKLNLCGNTTAEPDCGPACHRFEDEPHSGKQICKLKVVRTSTLGVVKPAIKIIAITMKRRRNEKRSLVINWI